MKKFALIILIALALSSCLTANFDEKDEQWIIGLTQEASDHWTKLDAEMKQERIEAEKEGKQQWLWGDPAGGGGK